MIISASRRTDIPAYYSQWLFNRLREGYVLVRNPMNAHQIGRISLSPDVVDGIVLWTKNPVPILGYLGELEPWHYYVQFTLTAYGRDVEPNLPSKNDILIPAFRKLSKAVGRDRVVWRYDPIFLSDRYTMEYHCRYFRVLASKLCGYTEKCTVSFLDWYQTIAKNMEILKVKAETSGQQREIMERLAEIAGEYGLVLDTCAEAGDFEACGIRRAHCIDRERLERIGGCRLSAKKDPNQRPECGCVESIDIGAYGTCPSGCRYCYANRSEQAAVKNSRLHNPSSPLLFGAVGAGDVIKDRRMRSLREEQMELF